MNTAKRLVLSEDDVQDIELTIPEDDILIDTPVVVDEPVVDTEPEVKEEVVVNAYTDMLQDLLRKQWDVINSADGIIATIDAESAEVNKEDVKAILSKLVDDTTVAIGMVTKALGVVDPSQEKLMDQGVAKAEEVISTDAPSTEDVTIKDDEIIPVDESANKTLKEDASDWSAVDFSDSEYYDRFWEEECFYQLQYLWENAEDYADDENIQELDNLSAEEIKDIVKDAASEVRNSDYLWEEINERIQDEIQDALSRFLDERRDTPTVEIGSDDSVGEINIEGSIEGE